LGKRFPVVSLTLAQPLLTERTKAPQSLQVAHHQGHFREAASRLRHQALLPFEGPITLGVALNAYRSYARRPTTNYPVDLFEDMILLAAWCGQLDQVSILIETACKEISSWPPQIVSSFGGLDSWADRVSVSSVSEALSEQVKDEISGLRIDGVPAAPLGTG